jgi:hypothetical protein
MLPFIIRIQDDKTVVRWHKLAAEQGHTNAHMWFNIAAISGKNKTASTNRDIIAKRMNSNQIGTAQKLARECVRKKD